MKQSKNLTVSLHNLVKMGLVGISLIGMTSVYAKEGDLQQELKVAAVSQKADIKNNQVIFFGPVNVTQGTININADQLRAFSEESGGQKTMVATGNPATFSQELDDGRIGTASANEIRYELASSILTLKGNAKLDQAGSQVTGNLISYNIDKQQLIAESSGDGEDRVITIFQPENHQDLESSKDKPDGVKVDPIEPVLEESENLIKGSASAADKAATDASNAVSTTTETLDTAEPIKTIEDIPAEVDTELPVIEQPDSIENEPATEALPVTPALEQTQ